MEIISSKQLESRPASPLAAVTSKMHRCFEPVSNWNGHPRVAKKNAILTETYIHPFLHPVL